MAQRGRLAHLSHRYYTRIEEGDHQEKFKTLLEIKGELDAGQTKTTGGTTEIHVYMRKIRLRMFKKLS